MGMSDMKLYARRVNRLGMTDNRRMTTDRFYGGVSDRLQNLRAMLEYVRAEHPSRKQLTEWVVSHTNATSPDAVSHHLTFLAAVELIELSSQKCDIGEYGQQWLQTQDPEMLYEALSSGVKGFNTLLEALHAGPMTDEDIMDLLVSEFEEAEMSTPGPAIRHREWLQVLEFVERKDGVNSLTSQGCAVLKSREVEESTEQTPQQPPSVEVSVGDQLTKEEIEETFDTGFGYQISGINPRRDDSDHRYVLLFATQDGPYNDLITQGKFEYIGEGQTGDQRETSPGNSVLIDAISSDIMVYFFYKGSNEKKWEYQGPVDVLDYECKEHDGRRLLVFRMEHQHASALEMEEPSQKAVASEQMNLKQAVDAPPQLTDEGDEFTQIRRRARDTAFSTLIRQVYDRTCAFCGSRRETPNGNPEVEAAHIYPKREGGADDVRNGIALCKLHHWAFDTGWLSVNDEHEILVKDTPDQEGYDEFKQLEGNTLYLPENTTVTPHPLFLAQHRELNGF